MAAATCTLRTSRACSMTCVRQYMTCQYMTWQYMTWHDLSRNTYSLSHAAPAPPPAPPASGVPSTTDLAGT